MTTTSTTKITELRRSGAGTLEETPVVFEWTGDTHTSMQGELKTSLHVQTARRVLPGSSNVVEHCMSASWEPFECNGEWSDRWAGSGFAWDTYLAFARMVQRMPLVRLTLDKMSYVGILTNFTSRYRTVDQIYWSFMISPHLNEAVGAPVPTPPRKVERQSITQWASEARDLADTLQESLINAQSLPIKTEDVLSANDQQLEIEDAVSRVENISINVQVTTPAQLLLLATAFRRVRGAGINLSAGVQTTRADQAVSYEDALLSLNYEIWRTQAYTNGLLATGRARQAELDMRARAGQHPRAIYRPRQGESLERISMRFYGTADSWRTIYDANHLESLVLDGTEELIIPQQAA